MNNNPTYIILLFLCRHGNRGVLGSPRGGAQRYSPPRAGPMGLQLRPAHHPEDNPRGRPDLCLLRYGSKAAQRDVLQVRQCPVMYCRWGSAQGCTSGEAVTRDVLQVRQCPVMCFRWSSAQGCTSDEAVPRDVLQVRQCPVMYFRWGSVQWCTSGEAVPRDVLQVRQCPNKVKVKSSMARSLPVENLLPQNVGSIINYLQ